MKGGWIFYCLMLLIRVVQAAESPKLTASLSAPMIRPGEVVRLNVSIKTDEDFEIAPPQWNIPPGIDNRGMETRRALESHLKPGPQGMEFEKKRTIEFVYQLHVVKEGRYKLGPFQITIEGKGFSLGPVELDVTTKAPAQPKGRPGFGQIMPPWLDEEEGSLFGQLLRRQRQQEEQIPSKNLPVDENEVFFVTLETDKKEVFEGEQVFASWYIYTKGNIHQFDRLKFPNLKGFWKEDVEPAPNLNFQQEYVNGALFHRALLASYALFPIRAGEIVIDDYKIRALVSVPPSGGGFSFGQPTSLTRSSASLAIKVKPLPAQGKQDFFIGGVGQYKVEAHVDQQNFVQGQPFVLKLRFEGDGNAKLIELPKIQWPSYFELYDTQSESRFFQSGKSYKEFTLLVIPKESGVLKLPPLEFSYFEPITATYKSIQTQEVALQVLPGVVAPENSARLRDLEPKKKDEKPTLPLPVKSAEAASLLNSWSWFSGYTAFYVWAILYGILLGGFVLVQWFWTRQLRYRKTLQEELADRRKKTEIALRTSDFILAATEVINAIYFLLGRLLDDGGLSKELVDLLDHLPPSVRGEVAAPLRKELEVLQTVAFAPKDAWNNLADKQEFQKHIDQVFQLLTQTLKLIEEEA